MTLRPGASKYNSATPFVVPGSERAVWAALSWENEMILCPECESDLDIEVEDLDEGEVISCVECGTDFEVVATEPLELSPVGDEDDDDEDEDEEDGDY